MSLISKSARVLANHNQSTNASSSLFPPNAVYPSDHFFLYLLLHGITKLHFTSRHNTPRRVRCVRVYPTLGRKPACSTWPPPPQPNQTGQKQIQRPSPTRPVSLLVDKPGV